MMRILWMVILWDCIVFGMHKDIIPMSENNTKNAEGISLPSPSISVASQLSDEEICASVIKKQPIPPEVTPFLAKIIRNSNHGEMSEESALDRDEIQDIVMQAVSDALEEKERQIKNRLSKKQTAYITSAATIIAAVISATTAAYMNSSHSKC